ncbi:hypothetical protein KIN20_028359 [Parelaphostrongylus tenuis]|uniref:Uncharacterized protein n=1 Tax=Parelaphostrongylus tenuis TaxID=148309 RepID=A0AAD5R0Y3_PARTN|nr:hypothetical protein KIN20_028359 [Parelaphostrongylus tenuis]
MMRCLVRYTILWCTTQKESGLQKAEHGFTHLSPVFVKHSRCVDTAQISANGSPLTVIAIGSWTNRRPPISTPQLEQNDEEVECTSKEWKARAVRISSEESS